MFWSLKVHITQGDHEGKAVIVSWVTPNEAGSNKVLYWSENSKLKKHAFGKVYTYKFYNYTSGYIHHCTISNLKVQIIQFNLHYLSRSRQLLFFSLGFLNSLTYLLAVQHQILLWSGNWVLSENVLVRHSSRSRSGCPLYVWSHWWVNCSCHSCLFVVPRS